MGSARRWWSMRTSIARACTRKPPPGRSWPGARRCSGGAGVPDVVRLDPAATARSGVGPAAYGEFERVFGSKVMGRWPQHRVVDGLDQLEILLDKGNLVIHPRCEHLRAAFLNYSRKRAPPATGWTSRRTVTRTRT